MTIRPSQEALMYPQQPYPQQPYQTPQPLRPPKKSKAWWIILLILAPFALCFVGIGAIVTGESKDRPDAGVSQPLSESARKRIAMKECRKSLGMPSSAVFSDEGQVGLVMTDGSNQVIVAGNVTSSGVRSGYRCVVRVDDDYSVRVLESRLR